MSGPKPLAKFRVRPENKALYYLVYVWRTLSDFRKGNPGNSHALGLCKSFMVLRFRNGKERTLPIMGEVHFCKYHLGVGIISHEFTHATIAWAARRKCVPDFTPIRDDAYGSYFKRNSPDERFCRALGEMVRQCVSELYRRKLIE